MLVWCTKRSFDSSSGVMKPKPFSSLNHFTVPVAIFPPLSRRTAGKVTGRTSRRCDRVQPELLDRGVAHLELLHLAGDRHRELVDDLHVARHLEVRDLAAAPLAQRVAVERGALAELDPGHDLLAVALVGYPDHLRVGDV